MNHGKRQPEKLRHGALSLALVAGIVAAVLLLNVGMSLLSSANLWYIDLSPESYYNTYIGDTVEKSATMYTLMPETVNYLQQIIDDANAKRGEDDPVEVEIIFCAEPDLLVRMETMRYVYYTALNLQKKFPDTIHVSYRDVWSNPSSVDMYRSTSFSNIFQTDIIVASGSEFRVNTVRSFYTYDSEGDMSTPVGYNGQKQFVKQILDVTGAAAPICCLTVNHGEPYADWKLSERDKWPEYREFLKVIEGAGYEVQFLDLSKEDIPENCRLIITLDPQTDFVSSYGDSNVKESETVRLDAFLKKSYSYMVMVDASTPELPNLEEYLEFWGIEFMRGEGQNEAGETVSGNWQITDSANQLGQGGQSFVGQYVEGKGLGNAVLIDIINSATAPKIYFDNAMPIRYSDYYGMKWIAADELTETPGHSFGYYESNYIGRSIYDMFCAGSTQAPAHYTLVKDGKPLTDAEGNPIKGSGDDKGIFKLMTISRESHVVEEGQGYTNVNQSSYVCAIGSTAFVTDAVLGTTAYGNTDALLATLRYIGKEVNPVGLSFLSLYDDDVKDELYSSVDGQTGEQTVLPGINATATWLAVIPAVIMIVTGTVVLIRRKLRQ